MTKNIKVAVIGAGMMGKNHMKTYKSLNGVELVGVYDIFPEAAKAAAETFGIRAFSSMEEVAENVDAVSVVTTSVTHADVGEFFLNKGIHCMMEKPLACTEEECQRLISAADKNNVVLLVGHIERFNPAVEQMGKLLSDTSKIRSLTAQRMSAASGRITDVDVSMDLMIHDVEVIQSLVKSPVVNIQAASVKTKESPMGKDYITALLEFENGATANITASRITQARVRTLTVTTDTNYIDMDFINQSINVHSQGRMPYGQSGKHSGMDELRSERQRRTAVHSDQPAAVRRTESLPELRPWRSDAAHYRTKRPRRAARYLENSGKTRFF